jgi:hypothetical protein
LTLKNFVVDSEYVARRLTRAGGLRMSNWFSTVRGAAFVMGVLLWLPSLGDAQTGAHGYAGGGIGASECASGCPPDRTVYENVGLIGGGYALSLRKGRLWIAGDVNSRISNGYFDASGGPALVLGLRSPDTHRVEPFVQGGFRFGEDQGWNAGSGINVWTGGRIGLRVEYQYQFQNTTFEALNPSQPSLPPVHWENWLDQHLVRAGIVIR